MSKSTSSDYKGSSSSTTKTKRSSSSDNDFDWIFDYILQFLESETFDHSIMNFIDEKCVHFDSEDENKFIYTDIHREFKDHVETLILSNLGELGITAELFYESCEKGRNGRDVNRNVFERLVAMDDFLTFKKIMVKRNLELQLEAFRTFVNINSPHKGSSNTANSKVPSPVRPSTNSATDDDMDDVLQQSLMEMELMHRQEQLEQAQLEQAVALSLAIEEERLRKLAEIAENAARDFERSSKDNYSYNAKDDDNVIRSGIGSKEGDVQDSIAVNYSIHNNTYRAVSVSANQDDAYLNSDENITASVDYKGEQTKPDDENISIRNKTKQHNKNASINCSNKLGDIKFADPKPLKINSNILGARPLPAIGVGKSDSASLNELTNELNKKKREVESNFKENQVAIQQQKEETELLRRHLTVDPEEAERRAAYMREQRDRLIAMKKAERDRAAGIDRTSGRFNNNNEDADKVMEAISRVQSEKASPSGADAKDASPDSGNKGLSADEVERRRSIMAMALARRMKLELIENEESRLTSKFASDYNAAFGDGSGGAFSELDRNLKSMALSRVENRERQVLLAEKNKIALKKKKGAQVVETDIDDGYYN